MPTVWGVERPWADLNSGGVLFHGSRPGLAVGTLLEPSGSTVSADDPRLAGRNHRLSPKNAVSVTSVPTDALMWGRYADPEPVVYIVEPVPGLEAVDVWRAGPCDSGSRWRLLEGRVPAARIIGVLADPHEWETR